jgi:hypothetical protein
MQQTNFGGGGYQHSNMVMQTPNGTQMMNLPYASEEPTVIAPNESRIDVLDGLGEQSHYYMNEQSMRQQVQQSHIPSQYQG